MIKLITRFIGFLTGRTKMESLKIKIASAISDPQERLKLLEAAYRKFSVDLTQNERRLLKKEMKKLKKQILDRG